MLDGQPVREDARHRSCVPTDDSSERLDDRLASARVEEPPGCRGIVGDQRPWNAESQTGGHFQLGHLVIGRIDRVWMTDPERLTQRTVETSQSGLPFANEVASVPARRKGMRSKTVRPREPNGPHLVEREVSSR